MIQKIKTQTQIIEELEQENARLREEKQQYQQEIDTLREVSTALISTFELPQVLDNILVYLEKVIHYDSACIFLIEEERVLAVAGRGFPDLSIVVGREYPLDSISWELRETLSPIRVDDAQLDPRFHGWGETDYVHGWMAVPLIVRDKVIAYLTLDSRKKRAFKDSDEIAAQAFANQAAAAIEHARLFETERRQRARAETLQKVGALIASSLDLDEVLHTIAHQVLNLMDVPSCNIMLLESPSTLVWRISLGIPEEWARFGYHRVGHGLSGWVASHRKPLFVYEMADDPRTSHPNMVRKFDRHSFLGAPMEVKGELVGVLNVYTSEPRHFSKDDIALMETFARQAAIAVENARLFEQVQNQAMSLEAQIMARTAEMVSVNEQLRDEISERSRMQDELHEYATSLERRAVHLQVAAEIARDATLTFRLGDLLNRAVSLVRERFSFYYAGIFLVDEEGQQAHLKAATGEAGQRMLAAQHKLRVGEAGIVGHVAGTGEHRIAVDVGVDSVFLKNPLLPETRSELALPLRVGEWVIGVLDVQSQKANAFDDEDITILQLMADQLAIAIESARLLSKTRERVQELTGLHEIAQAFSTMTDVAETYGTLAERLARLVGATSCIVALYDEETGLISAQAPGFGVNDEMLAAAHYPARSVRDLWNFRKQGTFRANKKAEIPDFFDPYLHNFHIESVVAVPMLVEGRLVGLVFVANKAGGFSEDDARLLGVFASQAGIVIENARLFERTSRQLDELSALHGISTAAAEASNETDLIQQSFSLIGDRLFPDNFGVLLVDETGQALVVQTSHRIGKSVELQKIPLGQGITGKVAQDGRSRRINDVRNDPDYIVGNDRTRSELCVPIKIKERVIGVINAESERLNAFSPNDERFLATLAGQLATGIEKIRLLKQTQKQSESL